ncbi:TfoX N-terminal domain-containing protein [Tranquillimonas rosea]|uniref:TfoX N-terminal domain-containing protein n=1 Tax=Tranquillimonas rosea TaxID=641238 RepID=A0A1H9VG38_9RHOB|nr:TfoX/Sxy family protein [Tranquillimonas rosea]SES20197.1 TfoX N-terminal domain-containing protein [Tranquillimonas rosea]
MAYDEGVAQLFRDDLFDYDELKEKHMFGGLAFLWRGHMLAGVRDDGVMVRVGKANETAALSLAGVERFVNAGRAMGGYVVLDAVAAVDDGVRLRLLTMATEFIGEMPPK